MLEERVKKKSGLGKAIIIVGPRQVGKTTFIRSCLRDEDYLFFDGDDPLVRTMLDTPDTAKIRSMIGDNKIVFIDEAQRIRNIGLTLKIIVDQLKDVQLWISGSSSFSLFSELSEPLTGRKWEYEMYPISWREYETNVGYLEAERQLENRLIYGMYPDVINNTGSEVEVLRNLVNSYLYKDILAFVSVRKPEVLEKLVQALALQVGSEVNYNELSQLVGVDRNTVEKYITVLEQGFVIFRLMSYSRNVRNEIKKARKVYFYDNGVRNMAIASMNHLALRADVGALWEKLLDIGEDKAEQLSDDIGQTLFLAHFATARNRLRGGNSRRSGRIRVQMDP